MELAKPQAGDRDYRAYVGHRLEYDVIGAAQFRLLCTLGLRAHHSLLDVGCGSLRAGRLFIPYLDQGRYFGVEPNQWLIEDAIREQIGQDMVRIKKPRFEHNEDFSADVFSVQFDFILAQSIFSHTGLDLIHLALQNFKRVLKDTGMIAATFVEGTSDFTGNGWYYQGLTKVGSVRYRPVTICRFAQEAGLFVMRIPWYHPHQAWYLMSKDPRQLPGRTLLAHLRGAILNVPEYRESCRWRPPLFKSLKAYVAQALPLPVKNTIKRLIGVQPGGQ